MYTPIAWHEEYSVGVKELDDQHKNMLRIINTLLIGQKDEYDPLGMADTISELIHHAYIHFAAEERYLDQTNYPERKQHILEHVGFIMKTLELSVQVKDGSNDHRLELLRYLKGWYSSHVLVSDRFYIPYLSAANMK